MALMSRSMLGRWIKVGAATLAVSGFAVAGSWVVPNAADAWELFRLRDDPVALTSRALTSALTHTRLRAELAAALDADDIDLASSFVTLASQQKIDVPADLAQKYRDETTPVASARRGARDFLAGAANGESVSGAGLAGVVVGDLTGVGDVRDLAREGQKIGRGEEPDRLVMGLSAVGLAVTGATILSFGAALPARAGLSTIRVAAKAGRLSRPLAVQLTRMATEAIDSAALRDAASAATRFDLEAAKTSASLALRPAALGRIGDMARDVGSIGRSAGVRGAQDALAIATDVGDIKKVAVIAEARQGGTRAVLRILGRGAIALTTGALTIGGWMMAGAGYAWIAFLLAAAISRRVLHVCWGSVKLGWKGCRFVSSRVALHVQRLRL